MNKIEIYSVGKVEEWLKTAIIDGDSKFFICTYDKSANEEYPFGLHEKSKLISEVKDFCHHIGVQYHYEDQTDLFSDESNNIGSNYLIKITNIYYDLYDDICKEVDEFRNKLYNRYCWSGVVYVLHIEVKSIDIFIEELRNRLFN